MRRVRAFVQLARPAFLLGGFAGFGLGAAAAHHDGFALAWRAYVWGQLIVTSFHLMVHFANDYFDQATDALATPAAWSGGSGVLPAGALPGSVALAAAYACAAIVMLASFAAAFTGNIALGAVGIAIGVLAWMYSAPPVRFLARGLGEADTVIVVALLVPLAGYTAFAQTLGAHVLLAALPGVAAMFAMMLAVELPDVAADTATGKRNLVVRWGIGYAAIAARTFGTCAVLLLLLIGSGAFAPPPQAYLAVIPAAVVAAGLAAPQYVAHLAFATFPFLGVALFGLTTCASIVIVLAAS